MKASVGMRRARFKIWFSQGSARSIRAGGTNSPLLYGYNAMAKLAEFEDGKIVLETVNGTKNIRARVKAADNSWKVFSTKEKTLEKAEQVAKTTFFTGKSRVAQGQPEFSSKKFSYYCSLYKDELIAQINAGTAKTVFTTYILIVDKWIIPLLGDEEITTIDDDAIFEFEKKRQEKMGRVPAKGTINQHNVVIRAILSLAARKKAISRRDFPVLTVKDKGKQSKRRPYFTEDELEQLLEFLVVWSAAEGKSYITTYKRTVLMYYIAFLIKTGIRPGKEVDRLQWKHVDMEFKKDGVSFVKITVPVGKTKDGAPRELIAQHSVRQSLARLYRSTNPDSPEAYVFAMPDGRPVTGLSEMFRNALEEADMRFAPNGQPRTRYSIRHSFATRMIVEYGMDAQRLAHHMGSSPQMINQHYYHGDASRDAEVFAGENPFSDEIQELVDDADQNTSDEELAAQITAQVLAAIKTRKKGG